MFELDSPTNVRFLDVLVLSQKNRAPDEEPGAKLRLEMDLPNRVLQEFDGGLLPFLYRKDESTHTRPQAELDGVEPVSDLPDLTAVGSKVGTLRWDADFAGYRLVVDQGLGGASNLTIDQGTVSGIRIRAKDGGTFTLKCIFESPNVSEQSFGKLAKLKSREMPVRLLAPATSDAQADIEDGPPPDEEDAPAPAAPARKPRKRSATDAFLDAHGIPE